MPYETAYNILLVRMWEHGHTFDELRAMSLEDLGIVIGYWHEKGRIEAKRQRAQKRKNKGG